ncbi:MAG: restriction endonuclease [Thermoanaerobaculia bacterium]
MIPDFQSIMLPILRFAADGGEHALANARQELARAMNVSAEEQAELLPSGRQARWANRVAWAKVHLDAAGLLESPRRGIFRITERGWTVLQNPPDRITLSFLNQFPEFREFRSRGSSASTESTSTPVQEETPEEVLDGAYAQIRAGLANDLLVRVKGASPRFFEELVVELLLAMGYGGSRLEAGEAIGRGGDEGIDGVINEDRLGLDTIYIQAKRWEGTVGRPEVQKFVGALHGKRARKGVFITTGSFSAEAREYVAHIDPKVVLIDGRQLTDYMIDFEVGVTTKITYEVKRVDSDYFIEE